MFNIKQSTARDVTIFAHDANGDAVTGLTNASFTKRIRKNGGAFAAMTVTITELENGWYEVPLTTTHTNTVGELVMTFTNAGCKQINILFNISARVVDDVATQTSVDTIDTNVDAVLVDTGTTLPAQIATVDGNVDAILVDTGTSIPAQITGLNDFNPTTDTVANVTLVATTTTNSDMRGTDGANTVTPNTIAPDNASIAAILTDTGTTIPATLSGLASQSSVNTVDANVDAILVDTGTTLPSSLATIDGNVDAILVDTSTTLDTKLNNIQGGTFSSATDSLEAIRNRGDAAWATSSPPSAASIRAEIDSNSTQLAAIVADTGELQTNQGNWLTATGFATAAALGTVDSNVDAIKVQTDKLVFTVANELNVNVRYVNGIQVIGDGESGTEWGPV